MLSNLLAWATQLGSDIVESLGYFGILLGMTLEGLNLPIPSEAIMTFAGTVVAEGKLNFWLVVLSGAVGSLIGALILYAAGAYGGRPLVEKYGKYILIHHKDLETADRWFTRHGGLMIFFSRMIPLVRTTMPFPAGMSRMHLVPFVLLTFAGSLLWSALLTYLGVLLGQHYEEVVGPWLDRFEVIILIILVVLVAWYVKRHIGMRKKYG